MANEIVKKGISESGVNYLIGELKKKEDNGLCFPESYSYQNSMMSAFLMLQEAEDKDGKPLLEVCTQSSIVQSLMNMAVQGLNPAKKQCYFVAYGGKCTLVPSYFGTLAILNRVKNLKRQPVINVVREGDDFEIGYDEVTMDMKVLKHKTSINNIDNPIVAAYAIIETDRETITEVMSRTQLEKAWGQGQAWKSAKKKGYESATHKNFPEEMAKKSVLNRASKKLINATDDSSIMSNEALMAFNQETEEVNVVAESVAQEVEENAGMVSFEEVAQIEEKPVTTVEKLTEEKKQKKPVSTSAKGTEPAKKEMMLDEPEMPEFM